MKITSGKAYKNWATGSYVYAFKKAAEQHVTIVPFIGGFIAWDLEREISVAEFNEKYEVI